MPKIEPAAVCTESAVRAGTGLAEGLIEATTEVLVQRVAAVLLSC
jgi:hypothetical protein